MHEKRKLKISKDKKGIGTKAVVLKDTSLTVTGAVTVTLLLRL